jgi:hypothetical protein
MMQIEQPSQQLIELISSTYKISAEEALRRWCYAYETASVFGYDQNFEFIASVLEQLDSKEHMLQLPSSPDVALTAHSKPRSPLQKWKDKLRRKKYKLLHPPKHKHHTAFHRWHASLRRKANKFYQPKHTIGSSSIHLLASVLNNHD